MAKLTHEDPTDDVAVGHCEPGSDRTEDSGNSDILQVIRDGSSTAVRDVYWRQMVDRHLRMAVAS